MIEKRYSATEHNFVFDWATKWFELTDLIIEVTGTDEPPWSPPPPTELDELNYQRLRFWFIDHEAQFIPIWQDYYPSQEWATRESDDDVSDCTS